MSTRTLPAVDAALKAAKHQSGPFTEYRVDGIPGLVLAVLKPQGAIVSRVWRVVYSSTVVGKRVHRRVRLGKYPAMRLVTARAEAARIMAEVDAGRDPFAERKAAKVEAAKAQLTFGDLVEEYLTARASLASIDEVRRELLVNCVPTLGRIRPGAITAADIDGLATMLRDRGDQRRTVNVRTPRRKTSQTGYRALQHLKTLFNYVMETPAMAERYGLVGNPAARLGRSRFGAEKRFAKPPPKDRALDDVEIVAFWRALDDSAMPEAVRRILKLILLTGQRPGEMRQLQARHVRIEADGSLTWVQPREVTKNKKGDHVVPLGTFAAEMVKAAMDRRGNRAFLFPWRDADQPIPDINLATSMGVLFRNHLSHIERATPHDLRRTAATGMRRVGVSRDIVGMVLNHTPRSITGLVYDRHEGIAERRDALERWGAHVRGLVAATVNDA